MSKTIKKTFALLVSLIFLFTAVSLGVMAEDYSLSSYPAPFVTNGVFSGVITVGRDSASSDTIGQSILLADLQVKSVSPVGKAIVSGNENEVKLGNSLIDETVFESVMDNGDIATLNDGQINIGNDEYDYKELLVLNNGVTGANRGVTVDTSLTSNGGNIETDYADNIYLETARDSIKYYFAFDNTIDLDDSTKGVSDDRQLEIKFLGKTMKITKINSDDSFTAYIGSDYFMEVGDSVTVDKKTVKLVRVGSAGAIVVDVDGVQETIQEYGIETVNGIEIKNDETFYESNPTTSGIKSAAKLIVGKDTVHTFSDGDAFIDEDKNNPNWKWNIHNLETKDSTEISVSSSGVLSESGQIIGIGNEFLYNDASDNPKGIGECIDLPYNYLSICLDDYSTDDYTNYVIEYEDHTDLEDVGLSSDEKTIHLHNDATDSFRTTNGKRTRDIFLYQNATALYVFYMDSNRDVKFDAELTDTEEFATINYKNTKENDLKLEANSTGSEIKLRIVPDDNLITEDTLESVWNIVGNKISSLGDTINKYEAEELNYNGKEIGAKDSDLRMRYGILIKNPQNEGDSDKIVLDIPGNQVYGLVSIGSGQTTTGNTTTIKKGQGVIVNPIPSSAVALSEEVTNTAQNIVTIGGPAINPLATSLFGLQVVDFTPNEAMIKLKNSGDNWYLLIAGYSAVDTRNAVESVVEGKLTGVNSKELKIVSATQTVGSYVVESGLTTTNSETTTQEE